MFNFWWSAKQSEWKMSTEMQQNQKGPLKKIKCSSLDYQLLMIDWAIQVKIVNQKMKCSFLDYIQLLMIGQAIWAKNIDQNAKKTKKAP